MDHDQEVENSTVYIRKERLTKVWRDFVRKDCVERNMEWRHLQSYIILHLVRRCAKNRFILLLSFSFGERNQYFLHSEWKTVGIITVFGLQSIISIFGKWWRHQLHQHLFHPLKNIFPKAYHRSPKPCWINEVLVLLSNHSP